MMAVRIHLEKPIDFFFLRNFRLVSNLEIRDDALRAEAATVTRDNPVIYRRTVARAVLDYLSTREESYRYYNQRIKGTSPEARANAKLLFKQLFDDQTAEKYSGAYIDGTGAPPLDSETTVNPALLEYVEEAVGMRPNTPSIATEVASALAGHLENLDEGTFGDLFKKKSFERRFFLMQLRNTDSNVNVKYEDLVQFRKAFGRAVSSSEYVRPRALGIAVGH